MSRLARYLGQAVTFCLFGLVIAVFADTPSYTHLEADKAVVRLSLVHGAERAQECRRRTAEELAKLAPNMRAPLECDRRRLPLVVELELDGEVAYRGSAPPTGLAGDGPSRVYERFVLPVGRHLLVVRLRDTARESGFDYQAEAELNLTPMQNLVIDFKPETGLLFR